MATAGLMGFSFWQYIGRMEIAIAPVLLLWFCRTRAGGRPQCRHQRARNPVAQLRKWWGVMSLDYLHRVADPLTKAGDLRKRLLKREAGGAPRLRVVSVHEVIIATFCAVCLSAGKHLLHPHVGYKSVHVHRKRNHLSLVLEGLSPKLPVSIAPSDYKFFHVPIVAEYRTGVKC